MIVAGIVYSALVFGALNALFGSPQSSQTETISAPTAVPSATANGSGLGVGRAAFANKFPELSFARGKDNPSYGANWVAQRGATTIQLLGDEFDLSEVAMTFLATTDKATNLTTAQDLILFLSAVLGPSETKEAAAWLANETKAMAVADADTSRIFGNIRVSIKTFRKLGVVIVTLDPK